MEWLGMGSRQWLPSLLLLIGALDAGLEHWIRHDGAIAGVSAMSSLSGYAKTWLKEPVRAPLSPSAA